MAALSNFVFSLIPHVWLGAGWWGWIERFCLPKGLYQCANNSFTTTPIHDEQSVITDANFHTTAACLSI